MVASQPFGECTRTALCSAKRGTQAGFAEQSAPAGRICGAKRSRPHGGQKGGSMNIEAVYQALEVMWKGMVSIFTVILLLTVLVYLINKYVRDKEK
jgi:hypothetical protein